MEKKGQNLGLRARPQGQQRCWLGGHPGPQGRSPSQPLTFQRNPQARQQGYWQCLSNRAQGRLYL